MNNFTHIIGSDFSRSTLEIKNIKNWWKYRLSFFEHFTLQSLKNQTNQNFYFVMYVRKKNQGDIIFPVELIPELTRILDDSKLKYVIVYHDDNKDSVGKQIEKRFHLSDYIYSTRIDSDDLFHKDAVQEIQSHDFAWRRVLVFQKGYCYDCINQRIQHYTMPSPPVSTVMFPKDIFLDNEKIQKYKNYLNHDQILQRMKPVILSNNKYIIMIHQHNRRSIFSEKRELVSKDNHNEILKEFGINEETFSKVLFSDSS